MKPAFRNLRIPAVFVMAAVAFVATVKLSAQQISPPSTPWELQNSTTKAGLRGIHALGNGVAWASGTNGTILRTEDGGHMWQSCAMPPEAEKLDFRSIWAWDANTAVAMSSGPGDLSRLYKTTDGCSHWKLLYTNPDKDGFWDAVQFWDIDHGLILGDPVLAANPFRRSQNAEDKDSDLNKSFRLFQTNDGGSSWDWKGTWQAGHPIYAEDKEGAFAASNSALTIFPSSNWTWFGTGTTSEIYIGHRSYPDVYMQGQPHESRSVAWSMPIKVPLASGNESSGVFSLAFRYEEFTRYYNLGRMPAHGIAVGGDYKKPNESNGTAAYTADGGKTWVAAIKPPHGYRSAVAWDAASKAWITAGTNGSDVSYDDGKTWQPLDNGNWNALSLPWVVGPEGRIAKLVSLKSAGFQRNRHCGCLRFAKLTWVSDK
jgi:photosystem II stability/assembly factor-like uncharacterized protein